MINEFSENNFKHLPVTLSLDKTICLAEEEKLIAVRSPIRDSDNL